jgi:hypothetical protein
MVKMAMSSRLLTLLVAGTGSFFLSWIPIVDPFLDAHNNLFGEGIPIGLTPRLKIL